MRSGLTANAVWAFFFGCMCTVASANKSADTAAFDRTQLLGTWAESFNNEPACAPNNVKATMEMSPDGKRILMKLDRPWETAGGKRDQVGATVLSATQRTLVIRYDDEKRTTRSGKPQEWEMSFVAPGVYRWRETSWKANEVNVVVGIRCTN